MKYVLESNRSKKDMSTNTRPLIINSGTAAIEWSLNLKEIQIQNKLKSLKKSLKRNSSKKYNIVSLKEWLHEQCTLLYRCKHLEFERTCLKNSQLSRNAMFFMQKAAILNFDNHLEKSHSTIQYHICTLLFRATLRLTISTNIKLQITHYKILHIIIKNSDHFEF